MITKKTASIISFCLATLVAFLPFNYILGSRFAYFSYSSMAVPALGSQYSLLYVILYFLTKSLFTFSFPILFIFRRLPLLFATIALKNKDIKTSFILPALAMILFCVHPVGGQAFYYSFYWVVPMIIYCIKQDSIYSRALSASFIAHAVGSIVWLYTGTISVEMWTALMPIVIVERLIFAAGMVGFTYLFKCIDSLVQSKVAA